MMKNLWMTLAILGVLLGTAHCLRCRNCPIGVLGTCLLSGEVTCNATTQNCFTGDARLNATNVLTLQTRGCLLKEACGVNQTGFNVTGALLGVSYSATIQCCNTTLCNGASSIHISLTVALCAALLSALWGTM